MLFDFDTDRIVQSARRLASVPYGLADAVVLTIPRDFRRHDDLRNCSRL